LWIWQIIKYLQHSKLKAHTDTPRLAAADGLRPRPVRQPDILSRRFSKSSFFSSDRSLRGRPTPPPLLCRTATHRQDTTVSVVCTRALVLLITVMFHNTMPQLNIHMSTATFTGKHPMSIITEHNVARCCDLSSAKTPDDVSRSVTANAHLINQSNTHISQSQISHS